MSRILEVRSESFDGPTTLGTITLDANEDMVFDDPRHADLISRFYYTNPTQPPDRTDRQVFDELYTGGGFSNGRLTVAPKAA